MSHYLNFSRIRELPEFDDHEEVIFFFDRKSGLSSFVSIHSTVLGPATGGTRCFIYNSEVDALRDALRLSRAMTYKCALADVPFGGGKGVIMLDSKQKKTEILLKSYARKIHSLAGRYSTGEDVGLTEAEVAKMEKITPYINGPRRVGELSPWAALGVFYAMRASVKEIYGQFSLRGRTVAIKGVGKVGLHLSRLILEDGGRVIVADNDESRIKYIRKNFDFEIVSPSIIHRQKVDIYAPCAMGGEFSEKNISELRCSIICGGANNQLINPVVGALIHRQGILYVPDYVANAGGLINAVAHLMPGGYQLPWVERKVINIGKTVLSTIALSKKRKKPMSEIADSLALEIIRKKSVRTG